MAELIQEGEIALSDIHVEDRLRPVSETAVTSLIASIEQLGVIKDAIHLRQIGGKKPRLVLVAGGHRLEAAKRLGHTTIVAKVWKASADWARMLEIDDNLASAELDALELATFMAERKRIHEKLYPETKQGLAGATARWDANAETALASFTATVAEKRGITQRVAQRLIKVGASLTADETRWLRAAENAPSLNDLEALSKEDDADRRSKAVMQFSNGEVRKLAKALAAPKQDKDPVEEAFQTLLNSYRRAPAIARARFIMTEAEDLIAGLTSQGLIK